MHKQTVSVAFKILQRSEWNAQQGHQIKRGSHWGFKSKKKKKKKKSMVFTQALLVVLLNKLSENITKVQTVKELTTGQNYLLSKY